MDDANIRVLQLHTPEQIRAELFKVGADLSLDEKVARAEFCILKLERASLALARWLYQELVMEGGQVVTAPRLEHVGEGETDVLLCATRYQFNHLLVRLRWQPSEEMILLADEMENALNAFVAAPPPLTLGQTRFDWQRTYVMGILNVTPDSFSGDALIRQGDSTEIFVSRAVAKARALVNEGADILDIGGESTRPGATPTDAETELQRVLPVLNALSQEIAAPISIDTSKAKVADAALNAGAVLVNDVTGLRGDADMARVVAAHDAAVVIMHNGKPDATRDFIGAMLHDLREQIERATSAGIHAARILIDPGLGFGKTTAQNLELVNRLGEFRVLGCPILIGPSRKGFISKATGVEVDERAEGTAAAVVVGIIRGANTVRVHDVAALTRIAKMTDALLK